MSLAAINILRDQRKAQIEESPFSETFQIVDSDLTFKGIFDEAHEESNKDGGNVRQKKTVPVILVSERPEGITERTTKIQREEWETGDPEYTFNLYGKDKEGVPVLWLF